MNAKGRSEAQVNPSSIASPTYTPTFNHDGKIELNTWHTCACNHVLLFPPHRCSVVMLKWRKTSSAWEIGMDRPTCGLLSRKRGNYDKWPAIQQPRTSVMRSLRALLAEKQLTDLPEVADNYDHQAGHGDIKTRRIGEAECA